MKTIISLLLVFCLVTTLCACGRSLLLPIDTAATETVAASESATNPVALQPSTDATELPELQLPEDVSYLQKIKRPDQPIYSGPSYDDYQVGTVESAGTYTIVNEVTDEEGNLWGRLKSGAGWVDLTQIREENNSAPLITVSIPGKKLLESGQYHHFIDDDSAYMVQAALRIREEVTKVAIYDVVLDGDDEYLSELFTLESWDTDMPIVADVTFPGPGSLYEIHFTDSSGKRHRYTLSESGRNGEVGIDAWSILD